MRLAAARPVSSEASAAQDGTVGTLPSPSAPLLPAAVTAPQTEATPLWIHAVSGLLAGLATSVVTNPIEVAKTRLQTQHSLLHEFDVLAAERADRRLSERLEREAAERSRKRLAFFQGLRSAMSQQPQPRQQQLQRRGGGEVATHAETQATARTVRVSRQPAHASVSVAALRFGRGSGVPIGVQPSARSIPSAVDSAVSRQGAPLPADPPPSAAEPRTAGRHRFPVIRVSSTRPPQPKGQQSAQPLPASGTPLHKGGSYGKAPLPNVSGSPAAPPPPLRGFVALPFPAAPASLPPSSAALEAARLAVADAASERLGRLRRAPDASALVAQTLRRAVGGAASMFLHAPPPAAAAGARAQQAVLTAVAAEVRLGLGASLGRTAHAHARGHAAAAAAVFYPAAARGVRLHTSITGVMSSMLRQEGAGSLLRGLGPRLVTNGPASAVTLVAFEWVKRVSLLPREEPPGGRADPAGPRDLGRSLAAHEAPG